MCLICTGNYDPSIEVLYCRECPDLTILPQLPSLTELDCSGCIGLIDLPELSKLGYLDCSRCVGLAALPELPSLKWLDCSGCTKLRYIAPFSASLRMCTGSRAGSRPGYGWGNYYGFCYRGPEAGRMILRMKKTLRQRYLRMIAERYVKSPAYRELAIAFYRGKRERDKARLVKWLGEIPV